MQLLVRTLSGSTVVVTATPDSRLSEVATQLQNRTGVPVSHQVLTYGGWRLDTQQSLEAAGLLHGSCVNMTSMLRGGVAVKVKMLTHHLPCGEEVTIDIEADTPMLEVKRQLQEATGVPIEHQKVMLGGVSQLVMGDKRTNIGFTYCGTSSNMYLATCAKAEDQKEEPSEVRSLISHPSQGGYKSDQPQLQHLINDGALQLKMQQ